MQSFRPAAEPPVNAFSCSSKTPFAQTILIATYKQFDACYPQHSNRTVVKALSFAGHRIVRLRRPLLAELAAQQPAEAGAEFQKLLDHRGIVGNAPIGALAHLGVGCTYALSGDSARAKAAYQDFLTLWKDADRDIPLLKQAKAEYAKLE